MRGSELRRPQRLFTMIRGDFRRRAFRTAASGAAVAVVIGVVFVSMLLTSGASYSTQLISEKLGADIMVLPKGTTISPEPFYTLLYTPGPNYMSDEYTRAVASIPGVKETTGQLYITYFREVGGGGYATPTYYIVAVDSNNFMLRSWLPQNLSRPLGVKEAVLGWEFPRLSDMPNERVFYGTKIDPVFRLPITGTFIDRVMFVSLNTARDMLEWQKRGIDPGPSQNWMIPVSFSFGQVSAVFVEVNNGADPDVVAKRIESVFQNVHAITLNSLVGSANNRLGEFLSTSSISGSLVLIASMLLVSAVTSATTNERSREFGIIRALGATRLFIGKLVAVQTILVTSVSGLIGILGAWILFYVFYAAIISTLGIPHRIPPLEELIGLAAIAEASSVAIGVLAAIWPALRASRQEPYEGTKRSLR